MTTSMSSILLAAMKAIYDNDMKYMQIIQPHAEVKSTYAANHPVDGWLLLRGDTEEKMPWQDVVVEVQWSNDAQQHQQH